jgi:hypothetical protein
MHRSPFVQSRASAAQEPHQGRGLRIGPHAIMNEEPKDTYSFESHPSADPSGAPPSPPPAAASDVPRVGRPIGSGGGPVIVPSSNVEPLPLEDEVPLSMRPIKDLDTCPNCGASMGSTGEIVCMRCGFDLKTMKQVKVQTGVVEVEHEGSMPDGTPVDQRKPLVTPGHMGGLGGTRLPLIVAGACALLLLIAYLAGVRGVFLPNPEKELTFGMKSMGALRMLITSGMLALCGLGSLWFLSFLLSMRLGDWALAAARMLGIVMVMQLVTLMNFAGNGLEWTIESILQAGVFAGLSILAFGIKPKDTPTLLGGTVILYVLLQLGAWVIANVAG